MAARSTVQASASRTRGSSMRRPKTSTRSRTGAEDHILRGGPARRDSLHPTPPGRLCRGRGQWIDPSAGAPSGCRLNPEGAPAGCVVVGGVDGVAGRFPQGWGESRGKLREVASELRRVGGFDGLANFDAQRPTIARTRASRCRDRVNAAGAARTSSQRPCLRARNGEGV